MEQVLKNLGYSVSVFVSCLDVIEEHRKKDADLLITDMTMPIMTGVELAQKIWQERPNFPIILMTGFSEIITREEALKFGFAEFLMKPVDISSLAQAIRVALDTKIKK